ncbi:MAG: hypothetical protein KF765_08120 [Parvibaculaceae bacterium]|nr:hypothetical protein [Parvibaculaceae bacterium]
MTSVDIEKSSALDEAKLRQKAQTFCESPLFPRVMRDYTAALVAFRRDPRVVNKLISQEARYRVVNHLLSLHAGKMLAGGAGGVTYGEMLGLCSAFPEVGSRVLKTMLSMLVLTGFASSRRDPADRRVKIYTPSAKLVAVACSRLAPIVDALQVLEPDVPHAAALRNDPTFWMRAIHRNGRPQLDSEVLHSHMPEFIAFAAGREGAAQIVYAVMLADMDAAPLPSRSALARQFRLSKTQVWSVFAEGERLGYFAAGDGTAPVATDKLHRQYTEWTALELALCSGILAEI